MTLRVQVLDVVTSGGLSRPYNEDAAGWSDHALWVVDGATSLDCTSRWDETSARWIATETCKLLGLWPACTAGSNGREAMVYLCEGLNDRWNEWIDRGEYGKVLPPAASLGLVVANGRSGGLDVLSIGDCFVVLLRRGADTARVVVDDAIVDAEQLRVDTRKNAPSRRVDNAQMVSDRLGYISGERGRVLSINPDVGWLVEPVNVVPRRDDFFLLCTDGFARVVNLPRFAGSWASVVRAARVEGLAVLLGALRDTETGDVSFTRGEYKTSDDATALLARVTGGAPAAG